MAVTRKQKEVLVADLTEKLRKAQAVIVTDYRGLPTAELAALRNQLRKMQAGYHIAKNTLLALALQRAGLPVPEKWLEGPSAVAFCYSDIAGPANALSDFFKGKNLPLKGAIVGQMLYDHKGIAALATLPSRRELYSRLLGTINAPATQAAGVVASGLKQVLYALQARVKQLEKQGAGA